MNLRLTIVQSNLLKYLIPALLTVCSCISQNGPDELRVDYVKRLLALDTGKIWIQTSVRINGDNVPLSDCPIQNYYYFSSTLNTDTLFYVGSDTICNSLKQDTLSRFHWQVLGNLRGQFSDSVAFVNESGDAEYRAVRAVTANKLDWEYEIGEVLYREEFAWFKEEFK